VFAPEPRDFSRQHPVNTTPCNLFEQLTLTASERNRSRRHILVIGEVAQAHDGSLGMAHAFVDAIANAGADAVKFQTHLAAAESTPAEPWRVRFSKQDDSRYDYWRRMEFSEDQWKGLRDHAAHRGLLFLSSPFSTEALRLLERIGVPAWKVASGETNNPVLLEQMLRTGLPILLSTGMSSFAEIDAAVGLIREQQRPFAVLQCTSAYPSRAEEIGLGVMLEFQRRYQCAVGLSDHSGTIYPGLAAAALGADILEVHVALSREMFGPDVTASVTTSELRQLVEGVRFTESMLAHPGDKDRTADSLRPVRDLFSKSVVPRADLRAGTVLSEDLLLVKKPGTGIPAARLPLVIGRRLRRSVQADELIQETDIEPL
jgi:N,N'-diacetyllegionaminate synthase